MSKMFEELWNKAEREFLNLPLEVISQLASERKFKEERKFRVKIKNVETTITVRFSEDGYPVFYTHSSEYIPSDAEKEMNELLLAKKEALKKEDYLKAHKIQEQINNLKNQ